jgi:hypothetical protein
MGGNGTGADKSWKCGISYSYIKTALVDIVTESIKRVKKRILRIVGTRTRQFITQ